MQAVPPIYEILDPLYRAYNPDYLATFPWTHAYGCTYCHKLALDHPDRALNNADSLALCALGIFSFTNLAKHQTRPLKTGLLI